VKAIIVILLVVFGLIRMVCKSPGSNSDIENVRNIQNLNELIVDTMANVDTTHKLPEVVIKPEKIDSSQQKNSKSMEIKEK
jgi:hypothetical protein